MEMDALCATSRTPGEQEDVSDVLKIKSYVIFDVGNALCE